MRRTIASGALAAAVALAATAVEARPDTRNYTCAGLKNFIEQQGAVVMDTGPQTFRRFAASQRFCDRQDTLSLRYVPTSDNAQCVVNGVCERKTNSIFSD